jgi:PAS domain S-box-containing protein
MPARQLEIAERDQRYEDEAWLVREDGSTFLANRVITALRNDRHELIGFAQITRDITERTQVAEQNLLSTLHQHALVSVADYRGRITDANPAFCAISGYTRDELLGQDHRLINSGTHSDDFWHGFWRTLGAGKPWRGEICNRAKDGSLYWVDSIVAPFFDSDGRIVKYLSILVDVTAHKESQRRLTDSELFLERVEKVSRVGGFMVDLSSGMQRWTRQSYDIHELEEDRVPTRELVDTFLSPDARSAVQEALRVARESGTGFDLEVPIVTAKGRPIWIRAAGEVESDQGVPVRVVGAIEDVTERRAIKQRLHDATAAAEKANAAKSEFLAHMSHEIRTPLNVVIGLGYLLEQTDLHDDQRQFLTKIQFAGRALLGIINNVLDLSKVEAGEMSLEDEPFDLPGLVRDLGSMLAPNAVAKGIELVVLPSATLPRFVMGDESRLRQIFMNLLNNSIKFTKVGRVQLNVFCTEQTVDRIRLRCVVEDTGIGIEPAAIEHLFTPFTQADASTTRRFGGTGLGLSIARSFIELMGGEVGVTSVPGIGSTFWAEIPLRIASSVDSPRSADTPRNSRVFIADLTGEAPRDLGLMVRALGWDARVFDSFEQLLMILKKSHSSVWPGVLILQLQLRDTDPQQLIASLQKDCPLGRLPPVIVVAPLEQSPGEREPFKRAGDVLLEQPLAASALFNAINAALATLYDDQNFALRAINLDEAHAQSLSGVRVLVVDDSDLNLEVAQRILEKQGAIVTTCPDGAAAVEHVRAHPQSLDVVLMDVQMPLLDGNEATRRIRGELNLQTLPIVALTAGALLEERQRSLEAGMNDFITKPFEPQLLIRKVGRLVEQARGVPIPMVYLDKKRAVRAAETVFMPSIDAGVVQEMFGEDVLLFRSLLVRFLKEHADLFAPISVSLVDQAMRRQLEARVHKLKGSAGLIGASNVMRLASAAETALQEERPSDVVQKILDKLAGVLANLAEEADVWLKMQPELDAGAALKEASAQGVDPRELDDLCALLESQNLAAVDKFSSLSLALRGTLEADSFNRLREAIDNLDFGVGAELLRDALPRARSLARVGGA